MLADWLRPVRMALDDREQAIQIFFRDDDAGWDDDRLYALLDCFRDCHTPIDLAVIPDALSQSLADSLLGCWRRNPFLLGVHQHGCSHQNHENHGRKCEFGISRSEEQQFKDLLAGKHQLECLFGSALDSIFTPPWNRCSQTTADSLIKLGFQALSRNLGAAPLYTGRLREIPVAIDWCGIRIKSAQPWMALGQAIAEALYPTHPLPLGIMLHHAVMDGDDLEHLQAVLQLFREHPNTRCRLMREFLRPADVVDMATGALALDSLVKPLTPLGLASDQPIH
ncbi:hypothetical protein U737_14175 [Methylomonas sp. LW13]|uniref:Polysaccharide deacetylase n=1 Tax=Methylomonas defluvii TaxID=3045149 RepID=A0ABU4UE73_9GAMM|nr:MULTISPECIES: hypothetical protein [unclassified Methylomonas]MDX8127771.1 hypothetical protein [Methylomonas sp. OY6]PKD38198.1 hypothetical protein CWO84_23540 [Methylomonas sp. Kb3]QBC27949.1 hypothetical protein U737_14175 [Methylomonas sp. LW13]